MRRSQKVEEYEVRGMADRLLPYGLSPLPSVEHDETVEDELLEKALALITFMAHHPSRETVERLLAPNDPARGRRAVDALIRAELASEDHRGQLRRIL